MRVEEGRKKKIKRLELEVSAYLLKNGPFSPDVICFEIRVRDL